MTMDNKKSGWTAKGLRLALVLGMVFWASAVVAATPTIKYVGSSTVGKFMHDAAKVYTAARFEINTKAESGGGERAVAMGMADLGGVAREVTPKILDQGVQKFLIGKDAIGAWVNASNPVESLSIDQLRDIFSGKIANWSEVGGPDLAIHIYIVGPYSATRKVFNSVVMQGNKYGGKVSAVKLDPTIIDKVAADPGGIGQLSFALGDTHPKADQVKKIKIDGKPATVENPEYPITRPLYLITKGAPQGPVKDFIDWSLSSAGQQIVKKYFVGR